MLGNGSIRHGSAGGVLAEGLVKRFGDFTALAGVDFEVAEATVVGLLGPNGAGKTTAIRILTTLLRPDGGRATVAGHDVVREPQLVRSVIGLLRDTGSAANAGPHLFFGRRSARPV